MVDQSLSEKYNVRRPRPTEPFRVFPDYDAPHILYLTEINNRFLLVHPTQTATTKCARYALFLCMNEKNEHFLWPIKSENLDNSWMKTAYEAAYLAMWNWVQVRGDYNQEKYIATVQEDISLLPTWSDDFVEEILKEGSYSPLHSMYPSDHSMALSSLGIFKEIWFIKFAYNQTPGDRAIPTSLAAFEYRSEQWLFYDESELHHLNDKCPIGMNEDVLCIGYDISRDMSCFRRLNWELPSNIIDLRTEFRNQYSGTDALDHDSLTFALHHSNLNFLPALFAEKELEAITSTNLNDNQRIETALKSYIQNQVELFHHLYENVDLPGVKRSLLRGRFIKTASKIEDAGIPIDSDLYYKFKENWYEILETIIHQYGTYGIYENQSFHTDRFKAFLQQQNIQWPKDRGKLKLDIETFRDQSLIYPEIIAIYEIRRLFSQLQHFDLPIGEESRNRFNLRPFTAKTSRNQPRSSECIFGLSAWLRHLIKPLPGKAIAYIDWSQQEFGIGAALSQDANMLTAYQSGDPYLAFGKQVNKIPANGTKQSHPTEREICKQCILGVQYGMEAWSLSKRIGCSHLQADRLLNLHKQAYSVFWQWSDDFVEDAKERGYTESVYGWRLNVNANSNHRSLRNFPMQANGAEMLRLAANMAVENDIQVCCLVHDAMLIETDANEIDSAIALTEEAMRTTSRKMLNGLKLRTDVQIARYPDRFETDRGIEIWNYVMKFLEEQGSVAA